MHGGIGALALIAAASFTGTAAAEAPAGAAAKHAAIAVYEGTRTCRGCHEKQVRDVLASLHYQQQGSTPYLVDAQPGKSAGMMVSWGAPPATIAAHNWIGILQPADASRPSQPGGCVQCHPGLGARPNPVDRLSEADYDNVDCLVCHAPSYRRKVVRDGERFRIVPADGVDVLAAARAVGRPTNDTCHRCHLGAGGGPNAKHGVAPTSADVDVHLAEGLSCVDCHITRNHRIGGGADVKAHEAPEVAVVCTGCHGGRIHKGKWTAAVEKHARRVACQTCHIPAAARDPKFPTVLARDWTRPVLSEKTGLYGPTNRMANDVRPEYRWWNRKLRTPHEPVGDIKDPAAKIFPWKRVDYTIVADARSGRPIFIKAGLYAMKGDVVAAARQGADEAQQEFSGQIKGVVETKAFSLNHQVAPASEALACDACHRQGGLLDFAALGYSAKRVKALVAPRK